MIYTITEGEMQTLISCGGILCNNLSPLELLVNETRLNYGKTFQDRAAGLQNMGLLNINNNDYILSAEGTLLLKVLLQPEFVLTVGRKNSNDNVFYAVKKSHIWYVITFVPDKKIYIIFAYMTTDLLIDWLNENFLDDIDFETRKISKLDLSLSYEEWYMFLISQFILLNKGKLDSRDTFFSVKELMNRKAVSYLISGLYSLKIHNAVDKIEKLFSYDTGVFESTVKSLINKGIFVHNSVEDNSIIKYSEIITEWLDSEKMIDTLYLNHKKQDSEYTVLFSVRKNGIVSLFDRGSDIRLVSSKKILWEYYIV